MTFGKTRRAVCTEGCGQIIATFVVIVRASEERELVVARIDVVVELRISSLAHVVEDLTFQDIIATFVSKTIFGLGRTLADNGLLTDQDTDVMIGLEGLLPLEGIMVRQGRCVFIRHLNLSGTTFYTRTTGVTREISGRTIVTIRSNMAGFITHIHTSGEMLGKLIAHVTLDIPFLILLQLVVVADSGQRVIERTEGLIFITAGTIILGQ